MIHQISSFNQWFKNSQTRVVSNICSADRKYKEDIIAHKNKHSIIYSTVCRPLFWMYLQQYFAFISNIKASTWLRLLSMDRLSMSMNIVCLLHSKYFQQLDNIPMFGELFRVVVLVIMSATVLTSSEDQREIPVIL